MVISSSYRLPCSLSLLCSLRLRWLYIGWTSSHNISLSSFFVLQCIMFMATGPGSLLVYASSTWFLVKLLLYLVVFLEHSCNCCCQLFAPSFQGQPNRAPSSIAIYPTPHTS